jgi:hypothetical protein
VPLQNETVAIPVVRGVDLRSAARLVQAGSLLVAQNSRLTSGSRKRFGHLAYRMRQGVYPASVDRPVLDEPELTPYGAKVLDSSWLLGWGPIITTSRQAGTNNDSFTTSEYPEAGYGFGATKRDNELLSWNGTSLFSYAESQESEGQHGRVGPALFPALRASQVAKSPTSQSSPDVVDNGTNRLVVWMDADTPQVRYSVYDSVSGAPLVAESAFSFVDPYNPRCFSLGEWFHVLVVERDTDVLTLKSFHRTSLTSITTRSMGACTHYDFWKVSEDTVVVCTNDGGQVLLRWLKGDGGTHPTIGASTVQTGIAGAIYPREVAVAVHPSTEKVGVAWVTQDGTDALAVRAGVFNTDGTVITSAYDLDAAVDGDYSAQAIRLTLAPRYIHDSAGLNLFDVYYSYSDITTGPIYRTRYSSGGTKGTVTKWHQQVVSHAFRAGDRTFVWVGWYSTLQSTWLLLDENLDPVGKLGFSVANVPAYATTNMDPIPLATVNWTVTGPAKDECVYHLALGYKERVGATDDPAALANLYAEPGIQMVELDFLPRLRTAQAGRTTFIAGAQLWSYDGETLAESGFHISPEYAADPDTDTSGTLTQLGTYVYRADLCYRNAQNEEVRSHSIIFDPIELTGTDDRITLSFKSLPTRRERAYILIFRNAMISAAPTSTWNLLNSRDPSSASFLLNDQTQETLTYIDDGTVTDALIVGREPHPGNSGTYIQPFSAPACEVIAAGKDRLWVAGGELPPGQVAPSRLFSPGETPAFNANVNIQVDRNAEAITGIGFVGDVAAIFRYSQVYLQDGDGPDNEANGYWPPTRLGLADSGAQSQEGVALIGPGLLYQSPAGFRIINAAGGLVSRSSESASNIGAMVDPVAKDFEVAGVVVVPEDQEVRWYGPTGTLVYNYQEDAWSTWTCTAAGAVLNPVTRRAALLTSQGSLWLETEDVWTDALTTYEHRVQFPWLHAGQLGSFQRIRRILGLGAWDPDQPFTARVEMYYDERDFWEENWEWPVPDDSQNEDTWGSLTWGAGTWGDNPNLSLEDSVFRFRRRPARQKCSVFSVAISDAYSDGPGFTLVALGLELAKKSGLDRVPAVTGGSETSNRG